MDCDVESGKGKGKGKEIDDEPDHKNDDDFIRKRQGSLRAFDKNKRYLSCKGNQGRDITLTFPADTDITLLNLALMAAIRIY
ncbi:hypothetical protein E4T56_gene11764 [Termitomyces sp. T112]|nr:hypothetical protein E4T56_gene11764 [Termitomyces sp. T112]